MTIYFDIGGVLFQDGMARFISYMANEFPISVDNHDNQIIYQSLFQEDLNARKLRTGHLTLDTFYELQNVMLIEKYSFDLLDKISKDKISKLWFDQYNPILGMFHLIENLKSSGKHTIGIISANFIERFTYIFQKNKVLDLFDKDEIYLTCQLYLDKKDPNFYKSITQKRSQKIAQNSKNITEKQTLPLIDCIYIEDKLPFVLKAKNAGIQNSFLYDYRSGETMTNIIEQIPFLRKLISSK